MLKQIIFVLYVCLFVLTGLHGEKTDAILLKDFAHVAIATDLEPDDVLAIALIFQEANKSYYQKGGRYPIQLIVVGEGNTRIKKMRMEAMLSNLFPIPKGVKVKVVEGHSSLDNIFTYDGEELLTKRELESTPFVENSGKKAIQALTDFLGRSERPLIVQLKPIQELLEVDAALFSNTTMLVYGSFNLRKTLLDEEIAKRGVDLQDLLDFLSSHFKMVGVVESYGMIGDQPSIYHKNAWTREIADYITYSYSPFFQMFRQLVRNWNTYLLEGQLLDIEQGISQVLSQASDDVHVGQLMAAMTKLSALKDVWNDDDFLDFYNNLSELIVQMQASRHLEQLQRDLNFAMLISPSSGLQFTLADICVALALVEPTLSSSAVQIKVSDYGFLIPEKVKESPLRYYDRVEKEDFAELLLKQLRCENEHYKQLQALRAEEEFIGL